jgi:hypothetical protein
LPQKCVTEEEEGMMRSSIREYTEAVRRRYFRAAKKEKSRILDEFTQVTGYHRKSAIRLLNQKSKGGYLSDGVGVHGVMEPLLFNHCTSAVGRVE